MKILITGAGGFIGTKLLEDMSVTSENELYALSRKPLAMNNVKCFECNILDAEKLEKLFERYRFDVVIHLAAITAHSEIVNNRMAAFDTNLRGTINLLNCFNTYCQHSQFLYASTGKVYGKTNELPISEMALTNPQNILGKSKRITEQVIDFYAIPENKYLICRIFNIYGEKQKRNFVVPTIIEQLTQTYIQLGNIEDKRDYLYIDDLSLAIQACLKSALYFNNVDYVNIGLGEPISVFDIVKTIEKILNKKLRIQINKALFRTDETPVEFCCNKKLRDLTGWQPRYSLLEGLKKTLIAEGIKF